MDDIDLGNWKLAEGVVFRSDAIGFIYCITNPTGKKYIGKKLMVSKSKKPPKKGKKRKTTVIKESDWRNYTSSSREVNEEMEKIGKDKYKFEILRFAFSKSQLSYFEAKEQFDRNVLFDDSYLNGIINCRVKKNSTLLLK